MMKEAPINFAPAVAHNPIGPCAKTTTVSPIRIFADSAPLNPVEAMSASKTPLFITQFVGNFREIGLGIGHEQIFRLRAIDRIAETPATDRFYAFAMSALRPLCGQTGATLPARCDRADQRAIANLVSGYAFAEFFNDSNRFVSNHETRLHCIFAAQNMKIGSANCR